MSSIVERLLRTHVSQTQFDGVGAGAFHSKLVNPDGKEAADIITDLLELLSEPAIAVVNQMSKSLAYPAASISIDAQYESGIEITEKHALDIMRAFRTFGLADFGPVYDQDSERVMGRGYWLTPRGIKARAAIAKAKGGAA